MNKDSPAVIIIGYNRPVALKRLLDSVGQAKYNSRDITLVVSIDGGGDREVIKVAEAFNWLHGKKELVIHENNLGLRNHVIHCGDLSKKYGAIIMLEEDCYVSPNFYWYASQALSYYANDDRIAGISLYGYPFNENALLPFYPFRDGYDVYFMQVPSSCGQAWTSEQWKSFIKFYQDSPSITEKDKLPESVKQWPETSWKKYFYKYMVTKNLFFVYPQVSLSTNCGDIGTHYQRETGIWRVSLDYRHSSDFIFVPFEGSKNKYDAYFEILPGVIGIAENILIDTFGTKQFELYEEEYAYSIRDCGHGITSFGNSLLPSFLNIVNKIPGSVINYGKKEDFQPLNPKIKEEHFHVTNEFIFDSGVAKGIEEGYKKGNSFVKTSIPYRLGNNLLKPLKFLMGRK